MYFKIRFIPVLWKRMGFQVLVGFFVCLFVFLIVDYFHVY